MIILSILTHILFPAEINLPSRVITYEPEIINNRILKKTEIVSNLVENQIDQIIKNEKTLVIINDHHRSTPSYKILKILPEIAPIHKIDCIAIATGSHEPPTKKEFNRLLRGNEKHIDVRYVLHDSNSEDMMYLGTTSRGTIVKVNPILLEYEQILAINSVEPHYFAGFTGGIKSIIPGMAALSTIEQNHSWAMDGAVGPTILKDNPLQLDLWEAASFLECSLFGIQMVSMQDNIFSVSSGKLKDAFSEAVDISKRVYTKKLEEPVDIVLSVIYPPLNYSLYQAQKGIENTRQVLNPGGEMILLASCKGGIGNTAFYDTLSKYKTLDQVLENLSRKNYSFGDHKAQKFASLAKNHKISIASELPQSVCKKVFADKFNISSLEEYLRNQSQEGKSIAVVMDSGSLVLHL